MALVQCTECGRTISDNAHACPGCGVPRTGPVIVGRAGKSLERNGSLMIVGGLLFGIGFQAFENIPLAALAWAVFGLGFIVFVCGRLR